MEYKQQQDVLNYEKIDDMLKDMPSFIRYFADEYKARGASSRTVLGYMHDIDAFLYYLETELNIKRDQITLKTLEDLSPLTINRFKAFLISYRRNGRLIENKGDSVNRKLIAVRQLYNFLLMSDLIQKNPALKVTFTKVKDADRPPITALNQDEVSDIMDTIKGDSSQKKTKKGEQKALRDTAIITLLLSTGIRVSECVGLNLDDIFIDKKIIKITRKGHSAAQEIHINQETADAIENYILNGRIKSVIDPEALFISQKEQRMTVRSVERMVKGYAESAGTPKCITPHKLRSSYGTALYEATRDINAVATRLGHASVDTAKKRYIRPSDSVDRESAEIDIWNSK